ncbi:SMEK domain-containing protein [Hymenobacter sp. BT188]|uniref:SMEK domain-containing protein n=1 Tax=Hymenobacter sp. BT188 TaxID=2763504 RepID=UPI0016516C98|nr:SMEK domain-containing protein [Hymenobacter sp. BT188]MBC6609090.1 SMEK domain-containing protein [Hymenobacter sp. BT188]
MITSGIIIGKLIDDLSQLQNQIELRNQLGLTDLNKYCEDFIKDVLNICYGYNLKNLNASHVNSPGLDLGDVGNKIAFQVTSTSNSTKVNDTLKAITPQQLAVYPNIKIIILGKKQSSYTAVVPANLVNGSFSVNDILEIKDICKEMISIPYDRLYDLYKLFEKQFHLVITEIEIPNNEGNYPTSFLNKLEIAPNTICVNANKFLANYRNRTLLDVKEVFNNLTKLPRISRDFLITIIEASESDGDGNFEISYPELKRKLRVSKAEIREELTILSSRAFIHEVDEENRVQTKFVKTTADIVDYGINNAILSKLLVALDFTLLDN